MTAPTRTTTNPLRAKALSYLRGGRVAVRAAVYEDADRPPSRVLAKVLPAVSSDSVMVAVRFTAGIWDCDEHPGAKECSHRLAVQMVTGYGELGGGWRE
jgi:hypothetical protein